MLWRWDQVLKTHPNGMRFSVFDEHGDLLATNEYFRYHYFLVHMELLAYGALQSDSVGGGFVVNEKTKVDENLFYKGVDKSSVHGARLHQTHSLSEPDGERSDKQNDPCSPPYPFSVSIYVSNIFHPS